MKHDKCGVMFQNGVCCCGCGRTEPTTTAAGREWAENVTTNPWKFACPDPAAHRPWWERLLHRIGGWKW